MDVERIEKFSLSDITNTLSVGMDKNRVMPTHVKGAPSVVRIGLVLNQRFVLKELIGEGGMGKVYKAIDLRREEVHDPNPYVAIKLLNENIRRIAGAMTALQREAVVAQALKHNGIASVYDYNRDELHAYIVMELIEGYTLDQFIIANYPEGLPAPQSYKVINKLIQAVLFAHKNGVVHADIKPSNIKVLPNGDVKVMDFGLARVISLMSVKQKVREGHVDSQWLSPSLSSAITPSYATLARIKGREPVKVDDVYALGCVIYLILTGRHPYKRLSPEKALKMEIKPDRPVSITKHQWRLLQQTLNPNIEKESTIMNVLSLSFSPKNYVVKKLKYRAFFAAATALILAALLPVSNWFNNDLPVWNIRYSGEGKSAQLLDNYLLERTVERDLSVKEIYLPFLTQTWSNRWADEYSLFSQTLTEVNQNAKLLQNDLSIVERLFPLLSNNVQFSLYRAKLEKIRANTLVDVLTHYENQLIAYLQDPETEKELTNQSLFDDIEILKSMGRFATEIQSDPRLLFAFQREIQKDWRAKSYLTLVDKLGLAKILFPENSEFDEVIKAVDLKVNSSVIVTENSEHELKKINSLLNEYGRPSLTYLPVYDEIIKNLYIASSNNLDLNPKHRDLFESTKQRYLSLSGDEQGWDNINYKARVLYSRELARTGRINEAYAIVDEMIASSLRSL